MVNYRKTDAQPDATHKGLDMLVTIYDASHFTTKQGAEGAYASVQVLQPNGFLGANPMLAPQTNPQLHMEADDQGRRNTAVPYWKGQIQDVEAVSAQSPNHSGPMMDKDGNSVGRYHIVKGDIVSIKGRPNFLNTKSLQPSAVIIPEGLNPVEQQFQATRQVQAAAKAAKEAARQQQAQEQQAQQTQPAPQVVESPQAAQAEQPAAPAQAAPVQVEQPAAPAQPSVVEQLNQATAPAEPAPQAAGPDFS